MPTELTPLLRYCLDTTAVQLADEFHGVFSPETVRRYVEASYEEIGDRPTVGPNFLPVIIERFAREQLWAIAQATGAVEKPLPEVLFVCERNAGRSQMAACLAHELSKGWIARSFGRVAPRRADRPGGRPGDGGDRPGREHRVPQAAHRRGHPRRRRRGHPRLRGRVPGVPGQALSGLAGRRSGRPAARGRQTDSLRALPPRVGADRDARARA